MRAFDRDVKYGKLKIRLANVKKKKKTQDEEEHREEGS